MNKNTLYDTICQQLSALLDNEQDIISNMANTSALLYQYLPDINWVGFYRNSKNALLLGPFQGKPACFHIPHNKGVCGACITNRKIMRVNDVHSFPGHIACDADSLSEIVLPIHHHNDIIAVLDIDSPTLNRFGIEDEIGLSAVVNIFEQAIR